MIDAARIIITVGAAGALAYSLQTISRWMCTYGNAISGCNDGDPLKNLNFFQVLVAVSDQVNRTPNILWLIIVKKFLQQNDFKYMLGNI